MTSGVSVSDTRVATRSPDRRGRAATPGRPPRRCRRASRRSRSPGSASCRGPRRSRAPRRAPPSPAPPCVRSSWRNDAASRLSRSTRTRTSSGHSSGRVSRRCGGLRQHRRLVQDPVQTRSDRWRARSFSSVTSLQNRKIFRRWLWTGRRSSTYSVTVTIETSIGLGDRAALPLPACRARRARLDPVPGLEGRHRRGLGLRPVAARPLRQERQAAPRAARRPGRRPVLRRPRARPERARDHVDARPAADDEHDGPARDAGRPGIADRGVLRRPDPPLHAARSSPTGAPTGPRTRTPPATRCTSTTCGSPRA